MPHEFNISSLILVTISLSQVAVPAKSISSLAQSGAGRQNRRAQYGSQARPANSDAVALATYLQALGLSMDADRVNQLLVLLADRMRRRAGTGSRLALSDGRAASGEVREDFGKGASGASTTTAGQHR